MTFGTDNLWGPILNHNCLFLVNKFSPPQPRVKFYLQSTYIGNHTQTISVHNYILETDPQLLFVDSFNIGMQDRNVLMCDFFFLFRIVDCVLDNDPLKVLKQYCPLLVLFAELSDLKVRKLLKTTHRLDLQKKRGSCFL